MSNRRRFPPGHEFYFDKWHRPYFLSHGCGYISAPQDYRLKLIDMDGFECCHLCFAPLAGIEVKENSKRRKIYEAPQWKVTREYCAARGIPAYLVEYELALPRAHCKECGHAVEVEGQDITRFWVTDEAFVTRELTAKEYAQWLWQLRVSHAPNCEHVSKEVFSDG